MVDAKFWKQNALTSMQILLIAHCILLPVRKFKVIKQF